MAVSSQPVAKLLENAGKHMASVVSVMATKGIFQMIRAKLLISGQVQGVNYRAFVVSVARQMKINGKVKNLDDGNVEIVCECKTENELEKFMKAIKRNDGTIEVENIEIMEKKEIPGPEFGTFFTDQG